MDRPAEPIQGLPPLQLARSSIVGSSSLDPPLGAKRHRGPRAKSRRGAPPRQMCRQELLLAMASRRSPSAIMAPRRGPRAKHCYGPAPLA